MRVFIALLLCGPLALATETIDGTNPPNPAKFGWNAATKTATLLVDLTETVVITGAGVTLDGGGHTITGAGTGEGVDVQKCVGVTVKNCTVRAWDQGIRVWGTSTASATDAVIEGNLVEDCLSHGISIQAHSERAIIRTNTVLRTLNVGNNGTAIRADKDDVQILGNIVHDNNFGIFVHGATGVLVKDNDADGNPGPSGSAATGVHLQNCTDCRVENNSAVGGSWIKAESSNGTTIIGNTADTLSVIVCDHCVIENNTVVAPLSSAAITVTSGNNHVIRGNTANNRFNASGFRAPGISVSNSSGTLIESNTTHGNEENIVLGGVVASIVRGNTVTGSTNGYGIKIQGSPDGLVVENNTITGNESIGIYFTGGTNSAIRGNTVTGNGSAGVFVSFSSGVTVGTNTCNANAGGIALGGTGIVAHDNTVSGSLGYGVSFGGDGNTIERNTISGGTQEGLYVSGTNHTIADNQINNNAGAGIYDPNLSSAPSSGTTMSGNTLDGNGLGMFLRGAGLTVEDNTVRSSGGYGIRVSGLAGGGFRNSVVRENRIEGNAGDGLYLISGANLNTISRNTVTGNGGVGIRIQDCQDNTIYDNLFNNTQNVTLLGGVASNAWSVTATAGPNIVGGPSIGGNFWATPTGTGWSETCTDANGDGFCDQPFVIDANNSDLLPLVLNTPPSCNPSGAGVYELGSTITLGGTVADNEGDLVTYQWREGATVLSSGTVQTTVGGAPLALPNFTPTLGLGVHTLQLIVDDGHILDPVVCDVIVEVIDTTDPCLHPVSDCSMLWPPNHQMVTCTIQANASDNDGLPPTLAVTVTSNEPDNGLGDGDTPNDIQNLVANQATGEITVDLRAERSGAGSGRVYTITITATDGAGNSSMTSLTVVVPRSKGQGGN